MVKLFSVEEMQALEREANAKGLTYDQMMENAGVGISEKIDITYSQLPNRKILAIVGSGNNGGDALVALSHLAAKNWLACAYIVRKRNHDDPLIRRLLDQDGTVINSDDDKGFKNLENLLNTYSVMLDGVFGTGIKLPLKEDTAKVLKYIKNYLQNSSNYIHVVAVDCPSGVDCETGEAAEETIPAEITVTMAGIKNGLLKFPAARMAGELLIASIGSIEELDTYKNNHKIVLNNEIVKNILPDRPLDAHKGTFGTALIIAGSVNYTGAALLAGIAAYRSGTGLVTMAVPSLLHGALSGEFPEATWVLLPHETGVISADAARIVRLNLQRATAILIGPGFGMEDTTKEFLTKLYSSHTYSDSGAIGFIHDKKIDQEDEIYKRPCVFDADGLKLISKIPLWYKRIPGSAILTPHPGEMSVLTGIPSDEIQADRIGIAQKYAIEWGHVIVLKGAFTVIAAPDGQIAVVPVATPALARAGTGDVLAGLIVGIRSQEVQSFQSACAGAWIHARAGLLAAQRLGTTISVMARDVLEAVPQVISEILAN